MVESDKLAQLKILTGENDESVLSPYLYMAQEVILNRLYPFNRGEDVTEVPSKYIAKQIEIANYLYNKRGAEGETSHSENGISRSYENGAVPESFLKDIYPYCKFFGGGSR